MNKKTIAQLVAIIGFPVLGLIVVDGNIKPINTPVIQAFGTVSTPTPKLPVSVPDTSIHSEGGGVRWANDPPPDSEAKKKFEEAEKDLERADKMLASDPEYQRAKKRYEEEQSAQRSASINLDDPGPSDCRRGHDNAGDLIYYHIATNRQITRLNIICQQIPKSAYIIVGQIERANPIGSRNALVLWRAQIGALGGSILSPEDAATYLNNEVMAILKARDEMNLLDFEPPTSAH